MGLALFIPPVRPGPRTAELAALLLKHCMKTALLHQSDGPPRQRPDFLVLLPARLLAIALTRQGFLHPLFLAGLQIEGVPFDLLDNVFLLHLPLEAAKGIFQRFALLDPYFCQNRYTPSLILLDIQVIAALYLEVKRYVRFAAIPALRAQLVNSVAQKLNLSASCTCRGAYALVGRRNPDDFR